jgi:hypothetical protein
MYVGLEYTSRGNYKCLFCTHKVWKREQPAITHVETHHIKERAALLLEKLKEAQSKPPRVEYREKVVYKDPPKPKYQDTRIDIFCPHCLIVNTGVRLPTGQTINDTPHSGCNLTGMYMVAKIT